MSGILALSLVLMASACTARQARLDTVVARRLHDLSRSAPIAVAHRGNSSELPENTLPAFESAVRIGAPIVELDFYETADHELVCVHDDTLDRTTTSKEKLGRSKVKPSEVTLEQIRSLDAGSWKNSHFAGTRVPTLEEALDAIQRGAMTMIERKGGSAELLVALLRRKGLVESVVVQSFDWDWLETAHALEPRLALAALSGDPITPELLDKLERTGASVAHWSARELRIEDVQELHRRGFLVCVYTVDDELSYVGAAAMGIDAITTNRPARLLEVIAAGRLRRVTGR